VYGVDINFVAKCHDVNYCPLSVESVNTILDFMAILVHIQVSFAQMFFPSQYFFSVPQINVCTLCSEYIHC